LANILVVDDAAFMRVMLRTLLENNGHTVVGEAANGVEAIEKYVTCRPDLVTMDITMPIMEGVDAVREIRQKDPRAKIVMCSAMGQKEMVVRAIQAGAIDFIVKPMQEGKVLEVIAKHTGS